MTNSARPDFALNPMAALVVAHNLVVDNTPINAKSVNKFSDKATAVKRLNAVIDLAEEAGYTLSYLPNGAIERIDDPAPADPHAASNQLIADAVANSPELDAMVRVETPAETPKTEAPASVGGLTTLELDHRIEVLVENPKRKGSRARSVFDLYRTGMTGEEFVAAVISAGMDRRVALANLHWDIDKGFIYLGPDAGQPRK